ncbi:hypothetical protein pmac_cds_720 [Pandoravirus macleodensis]|uniref:Uncharacterized protein n=1 Tax=Pandoravirus macleodensis TaxID=2107707 RepID=A0A2U7UFX9_9VIRU|nr:hypothetical protein pmac_cds_720 [Pandoravirus macleodensis]AVK77408.1 hypothetical protein pmac_cds_720 [Pandoravirus macleodensis]
MSASPKPIPGVPRHQAATPVHASGLIRRAAVLVAEAYAECKLCYVMSILMSPSIYADDPITNIALDGEVLYEGAPIMAGALDYDIVDRIAQTDKSLYSKTLRINGRTPPLGKFLSHEIYAETWLATALQGNDAAHCALMISAMVGKPEWKVFADTATNLRTGKTCSRLAHLARIVADAKEVGDDVPFGVACDGVILCDLLCALEATQAIRPSVDDNSEKKDTNNSFKLVVTADECKAGAVCIRPNAWRLGETTGNKTVVPDGAVMTTRNVALALARARANPSGADMMSAYDENGVRIARLLTVDSLVGDVLEGASLDACDEHRRALDLVLTLLCGPTARGLRLITKIIDANTADAPTTLPDAEALVSLASLEESLRDQDVVSLRRHLGAHWDEARSGYMILSESGTFSADARGVWRDLYGRVVCWDAFAHLAHARRKNVAPAVSTSLSWHRMPDVKSHVAHRDPRYAADLAYGLCHKALQGDTHAIDWLHALSATSLEWAMLKETVAGVIAWIDSGCQSTGTPELWAEPLIDWVLNVAPHEDINTHFDGVRETFDALTIGVLNAKGHKCMPCATVDAATGHWRYGVCTCASFPKDDAQLRTVCAWKTNDLILVNEDSASPYYVDTYIGAATRCLTHTPLHVDGRHILAVETFCPLLGNDAQGVEALVRALYTCTPIRTRVIEPAQLALAERALSSVSV